MPRTVDHGQRRAHICNALVRTAARDGLHAATMRSVAAEAGVSLRLVQYYFETKAGLLHAALLHLEERSHRRWNERLAALPSPASPRARVHAFVAEAIPDDDDSRVFHLLWTSFAVLAMTDPALAEQPFVSGPERLERQLTDLLTEAHADGALPTDQDPALEATRLLAVTHGLGTDVLTGRLTPQRALVVAGYHVDRVFGARSTTDT
ncbi:TetR/AcrR family transcriptional regulator [Nocardiopsis sp. RSe5-2]|uniref:TetR/AcrR family transcriptional regulator n=1 Tax=Nocardiopsis endophytica TaxID=3018445 RepID=A0ABT4TZS1_9ACTN|nr:TetR/AcrR family transcriptional regulator [Nocardiopsis endophytica]MDA2810188.1 TetR/AcrR family transcriptional regulator [Nocardiopsis endophytica]